MVQALRDNGLLPPDKIRFPQSYISAIAKKGFR